MVMVMALKPKRVCDKCGRGPLKGIAAVTGICTACFKASLPVEADEDNNNNGYIFGNE